MAVVGNCLFRLGRCVWTLFRPVFERLLLWFNCTARKINLTPFLLFVPLENKAGPFSAPLFLLWIKKQLSSFQSAFGRTMGLSNAVYIERNSERITGHRCRGKCEIPLVFSSALALTLFMTFMSINASGSAPSETSSRGAYSGSGWSASAVKFECVDTISGKPWFSSNPCTIYSIEYSSSVHPIHYSYSAIIIAYECTVYFNSLGGAVVRFGNISCEDNYGINSDATVLNEIEHQWYYYDDGCPLGTTPDLNGVCISDKNSGESSCPIGNPINIAVGNKYQTESDFVGNGVFPLNVSRTYNSLSGNWQHFSEVVPNSDITEALVIQPDGKGLIFYSDNAGNWTSTPDVTGILESIEDSTGAITGWRYTSSNNQVEDYDAQGKLTSSTDRFGNTHTYAYSTNDITVTDSLGRVLVYQLDGTDRIIGFTDPGGNSYIYSYDTSGRLTGLTLPSNGVTRIYHYEDTNIPSNLTGITDERGIRFSTFEYDTLGRAIASYHGPQTSVLTDRIDGVSIVYNADGTQTITSSNGQSSTYTTVTQVNTALVTDISGPGCSTCGTGNTSYNYYPTNNNLLGKTKNGVTADYGNYDTKGQYGYKIEAVGTTEQRRTDYTYDSRFFNKITTITEPSVFAADPTAQCTVGTDCKVTTYTFDAYGNLLTEAVSGFDVLGSAVTRTTTRQYAGPLNQLSFVDGPRTDVNDFTTYRYHPNDISIPVGARARLLEIEDANGVLIRSNIQYSATGKVLSESSPNGQTLGYSYYPGNDRLQTLTETDTNTGNTRLTQWTYLATGEVEMITTGFGTADATTLTFGYDNARRLTRITDGLGNTIEYVLDTEGNRLEEKTYDSTDALTRQLIQTFDIYNRLDTTAQANESTNPTFAPDGTLDTQTDGNGNITDYSYDALKRLTQVVQDQGGTDPTTADATTGYDYDVDDRLISVTDPVNGNTTYAYDDLGNLMSQTSPDTGTTAFQYDAAGNLTQKTDALGQVLTYAYDALNRLISVDAPGSADDIGYTYDTCPNGNGRLCRVTYGSGNPPTGSQIHYQYTAFGDVSQQQGLLYGYDAQGRVSTLDYPSGARLTYSYGAAGQISQVDFSANGETAILASSLSHAPFGLITGLTFGNGLTLVQNFDSAYRLTGQTTTGVLERTYPGYDANGNRLSQTDALASPSSFFYDTLNRLDTASGPFGTRDYDHDQNGNRSQLDADSVITALAYEPSSNRLDNLGATDVLLDANGNTLNQGNWSYSYTPHNRLQTATETATLKASYGYNGLGQRTHKTDEANATGKHFLYGTNGELLVETDDQGNILFEYLYLNGQLLAIYAPDDDQDGMSNQQEAQQGTLPINTDSDGDGLTNLAEWYEHGTDSANPDSDGDGIDDGVEIAQGTDPTQSSSFAGDGDINADSRTNLGDLVVLYQFVTGNRIPSTAEFTHADMNQDGELNAADLLLLQRQILQAMLGLPTQLARMELPARPVQPSLAQVTTRPSVLDWLITPALALPNNSGLLYYVHNDPLGTPQALTDETGTVVWSGQYDPFGQAIVNDDPDGDGSSVTLNVRFPGQYYDSETGLHYNYFRYYDPSTGRYLTADSEGLFAGPNLFAYASANPIMRIDPTGTIDFEPPIDPNNPKLDPKNPPRPLPPGGNTEIPKNPTPDAKPPGRAEAAKKFCQRAFLVPCLRGCASPICAHPLLKGACVGTCYGVYSTCLFVMGRPNSPPGPDF